MWPPSPVVSRVAKCGAFGLKAKSELIFTCAAPPAAVGAVTSTDATTSAAAPWPRLRVAAPTHPLPSGRPCPQTTPPSASQQPRASTESDVLRDSSIGLVHSGGTAHPPTHSLVRSKPPLTSSGRSNIRNNILAAFLRGHIHRAKRLPRPFLASFATAAFGSPLSPSQRPRPQRLAHSRLFQSRG